MSTPATIQLGSTGPTVSWAQYLLVRRTLSYQQIDGDFGPQTQAAVEEFQRDRGLVVDGIVGPVTWTALGGDGAEPPALHEGSHGPWSSGSRSASTRATASSSRPACRSWPTDGVYGPKTASAVRGAQHEAGIAENGMVDLRTWALPVHAAGQVLADICGVPGPGEG